MAFEIIGKKKSPVKKTPPKKPVYRHVQANNSEWGYIYFVKKSVCTLRKELKLVPPKKNGGFMTGKQAENLVKREFEGVKGLRNKLHKYDLLQVLKNGKSVPIEVKLVELRRNEKGEAIFKFRGSRTQHEDLARLPHGGYYALCHQWLSKNKKELICNIYSCRIDEAEPFVVRVA